MVLVVLFSEGVVVEFESQLWERNMVRFGGGGIRRNLEGGENGAAKTESQTESDKHETNLCKNNDNFLIVSQALKISMLFEVFNDSRVEAAPSSAPSTDVR